MSEAPPQNSRPTDYPSDNCTFAELLHWHLFINGTRPKGKFRRWERDEFLKALFGALWTEQTNRKALGRWLGTGGAPDRENYDRVVNALFVGNAELDDWKIDFSYAHSRSGGKNNLWTTPKATSNAGTKSQDVSAFAPNASLPTAIENAPPAPKYTPNELMDLIVAFNNAKQFDQNSVTPEILEIYSLGLDNRTIEPEALKGICGMGPLAASLARKVYYSLEEPGPTSSAQAAVINMGFAGLDLILRNPPSLPYIAEPFYQTISWMKGIDDYLISALDNPLLDHDTCFHALARRSRSSERASRRAIRYLIEKQNWDFSFSRYYEDVQRHPSIPLDDELISEAMQSATLFRDKVPSLYTDRFVEIVNWIGKGRPEAEAIKAYFRCKIF